jgi:hypothetical protein
MGSGCGKKTKVDLSSPKATAKTFASAMEAGDSAAARKCFDVKDEEQGKAIDAVVELGGASTKLAEAARKKFGDANKILQGDDSPVGMAKELESAEEKITGDTATLTPKSGRKMSLKKIGGEWKVDFAAMIGNEKMDKVVPMFKAMAKALTETADEIGAGKFKTADEAKEAMGKKMMSAMFGNMGGKQPSHPAQPRGTIERLLLRRQEQHPGRSSLRNCERADRARSALQERLAHRRPLGAALREQRFRPGHQRARPGFAHDHLHMVAVQGRARRLGRWDRDLDRNGAGCRQARGHPGRYGHEHHRAHAQRSAALCRPWHIGP